MRDLMIDIETMGTSPKGALISIGAIFFDLEGEETGPIFEMPIDLQTSVEIGMQIDAPTVEWWFKQSPEAISQWLVESPVSIITALSEFIKWYGRRTLDLRKPYVWANAPTFDLEILRYAFKCCGMSAPWHFRQERCVRTLVGLSKDLGYNPRGLRGTGIPHSAKDDCLHQIEYCRLAWGHIRGRSVSR